MVNARVGADAERLLQVLRASQVQDRRLNRDTALVLARLVGSDAHLAAEILALLPHGHLTVERATARSVIEQLALSRRVGVLATEWSPLALVHTVNPTTIRIALSSETGRNDPGEGTRRATEIFHKAVHARVIERNGERWSMRALPRAVHLRMRGDAAVALHAKIADLLLMEQDEDLLGEVLVQARLSQRWDLLSALWAEHGIVLPYRFRVQAQIAYTSLPGPVIAQFSVLRVAALVMARESDNPGALDIRSTLHHVALGDMESMANRWTRIHSTDALLLMSSLSIGGLWERGDFVAATTFALKIEEELTRRQQNGEPPSADHCVALFHFFVALAHWMVGDTSQAIQNMKRAAEEAGTHDEGSFVRSAALNGLALVHQIRGEADDANRALERAAPVKLPSFPFSEVIRRYATITETYRSLDRLDHDVPLGDLQSSAHTDDPLEVWVAQSIVSVQGEILFGNPQIALSRIDSLEAVHRAELTDGCTPQRVLRRLRVDALIAGGYLQAAYELLRTVQKTDPEAKIAFARVYLLSGDPGRAIRVSCNGLAKGSLSPRDRAMLAAVLAEAFFRSGEEERATQAFHTALLLCAEAATAIPVALVPRATRLPLLAGEDAGSRASAARAENVWDRLARVHPLHGAELRHRVENFPDILAAEGELLLFTPAEYKIIPLLFSRSSVAKIAHDLFVSPNTMKKQVIALYRKLGVDTRTGAIARLEELGFEAVDHLTHEPEQSAEQRAAV